MIIFRYVFERVANVKEIITKEDKDIASEFIFLNCLIENIEHDIQVFEKAPVKLNEPYKHLLEQTLKQIRADIKDIRYKMKTLEIKVLDLVPKEVNVDFLEYKYVVRGYEHKFRFLKAALFNHQVRRMNKYLNKTY